MDINHTLNEVLVKLFRDINTIEERAIRTGEYLDVTANDIHVIEAIGMDAAKNMTSVARELEVTTGTLTISRTRSEEDRRVVLISLSDKGVRAYLRHQEFHQKMIDAVLAGLSEEEQRVLEQALLKLNRFFREAY